MNVCIIGGGNIGTGIAACAAKNGHSVRVFASRFAEFDPVLRATDPTTGESFSAAIDFATGDLKRALSGADVICVTYPSFMMRDILLQIRDTLETPSRIGVFPGTGGAEFFAGPLLESGHTFFGLDRVPYVSRLEQYGKAVSLSKKPSVRVAALPGDKTEELCGICEQILDVRCLPLRNYLTITFTPSNPILHPARSYTLFSDYREGMVYPRKFKFYREWTTAASETLIRLDEELQSICRALDEIDLSEVIPVTTHYESYTPEEMTHKLTSIRSLADIDAPMKAVPGGYAPDFASRYFTEDVPFGLCVLKGFACALGLPTPCMDEVILWSQRMMGKRYIDEDGTPAADFAETTAPQSFGITCKEDIYRYYRRLPGTTA